MLALQKYVFILVKSTFILAFVQILVKLWFVFLTTLRIFHCPKKKLQEGNVFTSACVSVGDLPSHNAMGQAEPPPPAPDGRRP